MVETINAVCPGCKKTFAVPAEYEDRKVKCKCGQVFIAAKKLTEPKEPVSIDSARGKPSHNKSVIGLGVIAVSLTLILAVFLMLLFVFRDKWENDNGPKIRQEADKLVKLQTLESKAQSFIENGDLQNGIAKYQEALDVIQKNQTNNPKFTEAMGRISLAKREATELLEKVNKKKGKRSRGFG
ncbi:MAG TPA: hypothetical protein VMW16_13140 [Sedimentisphaerales bacterium]|nr:hypothetical protein [Sedimentisphaerales bacterium]